MCLIEVVLTAFLLLSGFEKCKKEESRNVERNQIYQFQIPKNTKTALIIPIHVINNQILKQRTKTTVLLSRHTAMDRAKLKQMGITHILNAAAVKNNLMALLGMPRKEDLLRKVKTGAKYYKGMNITYYGVPVVDDHLFDISKYFYPSAAFIHQALNEPESKS